MGHVRPLNVRAERYVVWWRTRRGCAMAERFLNPLAVALEARGWRPVRLYRSQGFPVPVLWVYVGGPDGHVGLGVIVLAVPGGGWGYHGVERGRRGYLAPCGDAKAAAGQVEALLKHRMSPGIR